MRISERLLTVLVLCLLVAALPAHASGKGERELKQAQSYFDEKQYTKAMGLIVAIMKEYPDLREETDRLVARIMDVRRQFNEKYSELVVILEKQDIQDQEVEKGLAIIKELQELDPHPDPAIVKSLELAIRSLKWAFDFQSFAAVMNAAAKQLADGKQPEAIATYLDGFAISRSVFDDADYSVIHRERALAAVDSLEQVSRRSAASHAEVLALPAALATLLAKPVTESGREGFVTTLQPLLQARESEAEIRTLAVAVREVNSAIDAANGEKGTNDLWLTFIEMYALGRSGEPPEGLAEAVRELWVATARKLSDTASAAADAAFTKMEQAFAGAVPLAEFQTLAGEARNRGLLTLAVLEAETPAWQPAEGLELNGDASARAAELPVVAARMRRHVSDADIWEAFVADEVVAHSTLAGLESRFRDVPPATGTDTNALGRGRTDLAAIRESARLGEAEWSTRAASATSGSVIAVRAAAVRDTFTALGTRALEAEANLATRIAGLEAAAFGLRRAEAAARQEKGRALTAGTAVGQVPAGKWPDLANEEYVRALADIGALLSAIDAWQKKWAPEQASTSSDGISRLLAEQSDLRASVVSMQISINEDAAIATAAVASATQLRGQGESAYQAGRTKENQKNYTAAFQSYMTAQTSFSDSLRWQENAAARARLEELSTLIKRVEGGARAQDIAAAQELIDRGVRQFTETDFEAAIATLEQARVLWKAATGDESTTTIDIYYDRAAAALKVTGKQEITRTDPIYEDIRGFMTQAELSFSRAASLQKTPPRVDEYRSALAAARSSVQAITAVVPEYREARLLALKIDRLEFGTDRFAAEIRKRVDASLADARNGTAGEITWRDAYYSLDDYRKLEGIQTILTAAKRREIDAAIVDLEVKLGLREAPISEAKVRESTNYYQQANVEYAKGPNDRFRWEDALYRLQQSIDANPLNKNAQNLRNQIAVKRKTLLDVLSPAELERTRGANQDIINRNTSRAEAIIDELLQAKPRNPLLLDLKTQIRGAR